MGQRRGKDKVFGFEHVMFEMSVRHAHGDVALGVDGNLHFRGEVHAQETTWESLTD